MDPTTSKPQNRIVVNGVIYDLIKILGSGGFGSVYLASDRNGVPVVIKIMTYPNEPSYQELAENEITNLLWLTDHLTDQLAFSRLIDYAVVDSGSSVKFMVYLVMEYVPGYDLQTFHEYYLKSLKPLDKNVMIQIIFDQILKNLALLHRHNVVHRDIKMENIMIVPPDDSSGQFKVVLIDFGLSCINNSSYFTEYPEREEVALECPERIRGTINYMSSQLVETYDSHNTLPPMSFQDLKHSDVWATGVILFYLVFDHFPFRGTEVSEVFQEILEGQRTFRSRYRDKLHYTPYKEILQKIFVDKSFRPSAGMLLSDLRKIEWKLPIPPSKPITVPRSKRY